MGYSDQLLICDECGKEYVYRVEQQRRQAELGFDPELPTVCPNCRNAVATVVEPGLRAGLIKWYREDKHFGFVVQSDGSEVFFHHSGVVGDPAVVLLENAPVWYELINTDRGLQAVNVHQRE